MKIKHNNKLKIAVMASIMTFVLTNPVSASINFSNFNQNSTFFKLVSYGNPDSYVTSNTNKYYTYLYYAPEDTKVLCDYFHESAPQYNVGVLEAGKLYVITSHRNGLTLKDGYLNLSAGGDISATDYDFIDMGNAADIFGAGMSEDELQQAIDDAIHNVEGDMTVDGSQDITGDQTVDGSQTVTGGQTISGGYYFY